MPKDEEYLCLWNPEDAALSPEALRGRAEKVWGQQGRAGFARAMDTLLSAGLVRAKARNYVLTDKGRQRKRAISGRSRDVPDESHRPGDAEGGASSSAGSESASPGRPTHAIENQDSHVSVHRSGGVTPIEAAQVTVDRAAPNLKRADASAETEPMRRLLAYYIDCVRCDERPSIVLYQDRCHRSFVPLVLFERWWASQPRQSCSITIPMRPDQSEFNRALAEAQEDTLYVGYPLFVCPRRGEEGGLVAPIFCIPAVAEPQGRKLRVELDFDEGDVNSDWLQRQFRTREERRAFLRGARLLDEESESCEDIVADFFHLPDGLHAVSAYCGKDLACDQLVPDRIPPLVDFHSVPRGIHNAAMLFLAPALKYGASLVRELRQIMVSASTEDLKKTALWRVLAPACQEAPAGDSGTRRAPSRPHASSPLATPAAPPPEQAEEATAGQVPPEPIPFLPFNYEQEQAIRRALEADVAVITGPPGTGKSQVAANLLLNLAAAGRSAVFASRNHKALDAVVPRVNSVLPDRAVIMRTKDPEAGELFSWKSAVDQILAAPPEAEAAAQRTRLFHEISRLLLRRRQALDDAEQWTVVERTLGEAQYTWDVGTETLSGPLVERIAAGREFPQAGMLEAAQRAVARYPTCAPAWIGWLRRWLWRWLYGRRFGRAAEEIRQACLAFELAWPERLGAPESVAQASESLGRLAHYLELHRLHQRIQQLQLAARRLRPLDDIRNEIEALTTAVRQKAPELLAAELRARFGRLGPSQRQRLLQMKNSLAHMQDSAAGGGPALRWHRFFENQFALLVHYFPLWAIPNLSVRRGLPLAPAIVDTVILDEASQCDIASAVPLLYRSKRAIIIGDPNQLRPVHKMKKARHQHLLQKHRIPMPDFAHCDFLQSSLYDVAAAAPAGGDPILLRDHFRCHPAIASYCNRLVYKDQLRVLTDPSGLRVPPGRRPGIVWTEVAGQAQSGAVSGAICPEEIEAVGRELQRLLLQDQFEGTVGVVTPFREQAHRIADWAEKHLPGPLLRRAEFVAATADGFQGDQRDVILCSPVYQPGVPPGAEWYITSSETSNLWNVAVSRARALFHVLGNRSLCLQSQALHLRLLAEAEPCEPQATHQPVFESVWERRLYEACVEAGLMPLTQYPLAGYRLDLAFPHARLDVEVDGERYHRDTGGRRKAEDLWRDFTLQAAGWRPLRFWVYELREDLPGCVRRIRQALQDRDGSPEA